MSIPEVNTPEELRREIAKNPEGKRERQYLIARSIDLGCVDLIPDEWEVEIKHHG